MGEINADPAYIKLLDSLGAEQLMLSPVEATAFVKADKVAMTKLLGSLGLLDK